MSAKLKNNTMSTVFEVKYLPMLNFWQAPDLNLKFVKLNLNEDKLISDYIYFVLLSNSHYRPNSNPKSEKP